MPFNRIYCETQLPALPGSNVVISIPAGEAFADMTRSRIEIDILPTADITVGVPSLLTPGGGASFIQHIEVSTLSGGVVLERIQNFNVISAAVQNCRSNSTAAYRELVNRESISDCYQYLNRITGETTNAATIAPKRAYIDLNLLGIGRWAELPIAALGGLRLDIVLAPAAQVFDSFLMGGPAVACNNFTGSASLKSVTLADGEMCYPCIDYGRSRLEFPFQVGDTVIVAGTAAGAVKAQQAGIVAIVPGAGGTAAGTTIVFKGALNLFTANTAYTAITIRRQPITATFVDATHFTVNMPISTSPFYVGQVLSTLSVTALGVSTANAAVKISASEDTDDNVTYTVSANMADPAAGGKLYVFGTAPTSVSYTLTGVRMRLCRVDVPADQAARLASMRSIELPILTVLNTMATYPSSTRINHTVVTPQQYHDSLGIVSIPVKATGSTFNDSVRGQRNIWQQYRWTVAGQSDPLQPIDVSRPRPTVHDVQASGFWGQLNAAVAQTAAPASLPAQDRLAPWRQNFGFYKPLNAGGATRNIVGLSIQLEVDSTGNADPTTLMTYVFHERVISIGAGTVEIV